LKQPQQHPSFGVVAKTLNRPYKRRSILRGVFFLPTGGLGMRTKNFILGLFWFALSFIASASSGKTDIVDSINAAGDPFLAASWNVPNVGWQYTPSFSYSFFSIGTKFGSDDGRIVTAEIFSGAPGSLTLLLRAHSFRRPGLSPFRPASRISILLLARHTFSASRMYKVFW
jgi:hypothetical protein